MKQYLIYVECGSIDNVINTLGEGIDTGEIEKYAVITDNGAPVTYERGEDSAWDYLSAMAKKCEGVTSETA